MILTRLPPMVSVAVAVWLPTVTVAVLVMEPVGLLTKVAPTAKVMLLSTGMLEEMVMPAPCMAATLQFTQGQIVPPAESEQVTLLTVRLVTAGSLKTALLNATPVVFEMTT